MRIDLAIERLFGELDRSRGIPALLGDGAGTVQHPTIPACIWVRVIDTGSGRAVLATAHNTTVPDIEGLAVYVKPTRKRGRRPYEVVGLAKAELYPGRTQRYEVGPHAWTHLWPTGTDITSLDGRQILGCRARERDTPGMTLQVDAGWYDNNGFCEFYASISPTFTAPSSNWRYDLLTIDSDGTLHVQVGTVGTGVGATVPVAATGYVPICAVRLIAGQTAITEQHVVDLRFVPRTSGLADHASTHEEGGSDPISAVGWHAHVFSEDKAAECDGSKTVFILAHEYLEGRIQVLLNGLLQAEDDDYTEGTFYNSITMATAPVSGDAFLFHYLAMVV